MLRLFLFFHLLTSHAHLAILMILSCATRKWMQSKKEGYPDHQMQVSPLKAITMLPVGIIMADHMDFHAVVFGVILSPPLNPMVETQGI